MQKTYLLCLAPVIFLLIICSGCATRNAGTIGTGTYYIDEVRSSMIADDREFIVEYGAENEENTFSFISSDSKHAGRESVVGVYNLDEFSQWKGSDKDIDALQYELMKIIEQKAGCLPDDIRRGYFLMGKQYHGPKARNILKRSKQRQLRTLHAIDILSADNPQDNGMHFYAIMTSEGGDAILGEQLVQGVLLDESGNGNNDACRWDVLYLLPSERYIWYSDRPVLRWTVTPFAIAFDIVTFPVQFIIGYSLYYGAPLLGSHEK